MNKVMAKILAATANLAVFALLVSSGLPSFCGAYQPKMPANLNEVASRKHN